jgi:hypothetical protein
MHAMPLRFDADFSDPGLSLDPFIDEVFSELKSGFLELPKGQGFVEFAVFESGYQALKKATTDFTVVEPGSVTAAIYATPIAFIVLRTILGFTPSEWADVTTELTGVAVDQGSARTMDRRFASLLWCRSKTRTRSRTNVARRWSLPLSGCWKRGPARWTASLFSIASTRWTRHGRREYPADCRPRRALPCSAL